ncbi:late competence development ComFB family protein [Youxingia wuxianensis]|uniref:Late competence development ComFB family protein n=1 Tax=Youxingia wuxianensis TaxID=2763678 RepID=A0A926EPL1_9FIRM|nr:late competence development ComFB family protein [Youxingia wuxianensis]MBC8585803.1 late competence development ComFB family protein [Youxingia wuxianensis]
MAASKKEFDKDYIFSLIMPSAPIASENIQPPSDDSTTGGTDETPAHDSLSILQDRISQITSPAVKLRPAEEFVLTNLMEQLVADRLDEVFFKFNCCRCDKCRRDVAALALNSLPPRYVVVQPDELSSLLQDCSTKDVSSALVKAILYVKNHPNH